MSFCKCNILCVIIVLNCLRCKRRNFGFEMICRVEIVNKYLYEYLCLSFFGMKY